MVVMTLELSTHQNHLLVRIQNPELHVANTLKPNTGGGKERLKVLNARQGAPQFFDEAK